MINFNSKMRKAFSMITAIFVILMLSTVGGYIVNTAGKTLKATSIQYYKEQSALLAKSYTELAIMGATANDAKNTNCLETINGEVGSNPDNGEGYKINVNLSYIGDDTLACNGSNIIISDALIPENQLYVMVDVYVRYRDFDVINAIVGGGSALDTVPWITYHRRTLQRL